MTRRGLLCLVIGLVLSLSLVVLTRASGVTVAYKVRVRPGQPGRAEILVQGIGQPEVTFSIVPEEWLTVPAGHLFQYTSELRGCLR